MMIWHLKLAMLNIGHTFRWSYGGPGPPQPPFQHPMKARQKHQTTTPPAWESICRRHNQQTTSRGPLSNRNRPCTTSGDDGDQQNNNKNETTRITENIGICFVFVVCCVACCLFACLLAMLACLLAVDVDALGRAIVAVVVLLLLIGVERGYLKASVFKSSCPRRSSYRGTPFKHLQLVRHLTA